MCCCEKRRETEQNTKRQQQLENIKPFLDWESGNVTLSGSCYRIMLSFLSRFWIYVFNVDSPLLALMLWLQQWIIHQKTYLAWVKARSSPQDNPNRPTRERSLVFYSNSAISNIDLFDSRKMKKKETSKNSRSMMLWNLCCGVEVKRRAEEKAELLSSSGKEDDEDTSRGERRKRCRTLFRCRQLHHHADPHMSRANERERKRT